MNVNALVWQPLIERYLLGNERKLIDLMAWNTDVTGTGMPTGMGRVIDAGRGPSPKTRAPGPSWR